MCSKIIIIFTMCSSFPYCMLALTIDVSFVQGASYVLHNNYKAATNPYSTMSGGNSFCKSQCDSDDLCNGYSIDLSKNGCYLSSCASYTDVPQCSSCYFASKSPITSPDVCMPPSTATDTTTTTTTQTTTQATTPKTALTTTKTLTETTPTTTPTTTNALSTMTTPITTTTSLITRTPTRTTSPATIPTTMTSTTTNDVTQNVMNTTSCICICREVNQTVEERTENRRRELIVNQKGLTSTTRKRTSAPDIRVTSKVIAAVVAIIGLVVYGLFFFLGDIISVFNFIYTEILNKKATVEPL